MITELEIQEMPITPGRKIAVNEYNIRQYRLHHVLTQIARLMLSTLEGTSNNTKARASGAGISEIWDQWSIVKNRLEFAMENRDSPTPSHEIARKILLPTYNELATIRNVKIQAIMDEVMNAAQIILSVDSSNFQMDLDVNDHAKIAKSFGIVDAVIKYWVGEKGDDNRGVYAPAYERVGQIRPDVDLNAAQIMEPSANRPASKLPDVADTDSNVPASRI